MPHVKIRWVAVLFLVLGACGTEPDNTSIGPVVQMQCGAITAPLSGGPPPLGNTDDPDLDLALEWLAGNGEGQFFAVNYQWSVWEKTDDEMILFGLTENDYADASFVKDGDGWRATGWGGCHWRASAEGWGVAEWRVDGPTDPESTALTLAVTERNCASGEAPQGRDIESVVWETDKSITIFILVEPVSGFAECQSNPEFAWTVDLASPLADRELLDGVEVPPIQRALD